MVDASKIKMFFFDVDGTLFDHIKNNTITPKTIEALKQLKQNGYKIAINTARAFDESENIPKEAVELMDCVIYLNGAHIVFKDHEEIKKIPYEKVLEAIKYLDTTESSYRYVTADGHSYLNKHDETKTSIFKRLYEMVPPIKKYEDEELIHLLTYCKEDVRDKTMGILNTSENSYHTTPNNPGWFTIESSPYHCNKGEVLLYVAEKFGFTKEETCAFGDGVNDIEAIQLAALGIAMGNARDQVKAIADYVTDDTANEGVYTALKHFNFI